MEKTKDIVKQINLKYFELPQNKFKSKLASLKYSFLSQKYEIKSPAVFVCNKTTPDDRLLVSSVMLGNYVFLKDEVIQNLHRNKLSADTKKELANGFKFLKENDFSVVIFPEKNIPIFGKCEELPTQVTTFLFDTNYNLKYFYLIGTYLSNPLWSRFHRKTETRYFQQLCLEHDVLAIKTDTDRHQTINKFMPSSASIYANKFPLILKSDNRAENIDSILYCCPKCKQFFSIYSEYNCVKCHNCGSLIEFSKDGKILFSNEITSFDDIEDFLFNQLKHHEFDNNPIIEYENVIVLNALVNGKMLNIKNTKLKIYADKFAIENLHIKKTYKIADVEEMIMHHNNIIEIIFKKDKIFIQGTAKENFYILIDLLKLYNS